MQETVKAPNINPKVPAKLLELEKGHFKVPNFLPTMSAKPSPIWGEKANHLKFIVSLIRYKIVKRKDTCSHL